VLIRISMGPKCLLKDLSFAGFLDLLARGTQVLPA
jgi:hypothetical protein